MHILIGLGNPGNQYRNHRHNVGFMAIQTIAERYGFASSQKKFNAQISQGQIHNQKVMLVKPQTFMNKSGYSAQQILDFYKLKADAITVFYDELDLAPGKIRIKRGGGSGGHNGIKSLDAHIGQNYRRVRIGIGHPGHKDQVPKYVLHDFPSIDKTWLGPLLSALAQEIPTLLSDDEAKYCSRVMQPKPSGTPSDASETSSQKSPPLPHKNPSKTPVHRQVKDQPSTALGAAFSRLLNKKR